MTLEPGCVELVVRSNLQTALVLEGTRRATCRRTAPPERYEGAPADERSDQFAFCVTCWELLFGERPFRGSSMAVPSDGRSALQHGLEPA